MEHKTFSLILVALGFMAYFFPNYGGVFGPRLDVTSGDALIAFAVFTTGGIMLWHMPPKT